MPYKYDQDTHLLIQLPEMKEPDGDEYDWEHRQYYFKELTKYKKQKAKCKTYPLGVEKVPDYWKVEGQILEEGKDFKIAGLNEKPVALGFTTVVVPIEENKKVEEEKESENISVEKSIDLHS